MKRNLLLALALCGCSIVQAAHLSRETGPTIYVTPDSGFEINIVAAFEKKKLPVQVVTSESAADYVLRPSEVVIHKESGAGKIARCLFAYCIGIEDRGDVSVQLVQRNTQHIVWAYQVAKATGAMNRQSMAEAIAKHMRKEFLQGSR